MSTDPHRLLAEVRKAKADFVRQQDPKTDWSKYEEEEDAFFTVRWARAKRYWLTVAFEIGVLAGLVVFAAIPWLRNAGRWAWSIHVGALPVLLLAPWLFGYVPWTFTSSFPAGGIVYPFVILPFRHLPSTNIDEFILTRLPQPLEPLSQLSGPCMAVTGMGCPSPVALLVFGAMIGASCFAVATFQGRGRGKPTSMGENDRKMTDRNIVEP
jgi:hypothetical protein